MATARKIALEIPELIEAILLELPNQDLLLDQRVCQLWRDTITSSPTIQEKLFYKPLSISTISPDNPLRINPMLSHLMLQSVPVDCRSGQRSLFSRAWEELQKRCINGALHVQTFGPASAPVALVIMKVRMLLKFTSSTGL